VGDFSRIQQLHVLQALNVTASEGVLSDRIISWGVCLTFLHFLTP
jgi:hypothetical protein